MVKKTSPKEEKFLETEHLRRLVVEFVDPKVMDDAQALYARNEADQADRMIEARYNVLADATLKTSSPFFDAVLQASAALSNVRQMSGMPTFDLMNGRYDVPDDRKISILDEMEDLLLANRDHQFQVSQRQWDTELDKLARSKEIAAAPVANDMQAPADSSTTILSRFKENAPTAILATGAVLFMGGVAFSTLTGRKTSNVSNKVASAPTSAAASSAMQPSVADTASSGESNDLPKETPPSEPFERHVSELPEKAPDAKKSSGTSIAFSDAFKIAHDTKNKEATLEYNNEKKLNLINEEWESWLAAIGMGDMIPAGFAHMSAAERNAIGMDLLQSHASTFAGKKHGRANANDVDASLKDVMPDINALIEQKKKTDPENAASTADGQGASRQAPDDTASRDRQHEADDTSAASPEAANFARPDSATTARAPVAQDSVATGRRPEFLGEIKFDVNGKRVQESLSRLNDSFAKDGYEIRYKSEADSVFRIVTPEALKTDDVLKTNLKSGKGQTDWISPDKLVTTTYKDGVYKFNLNQPVADPDKRYDAFSGPVAKAVKELKDSGHKSITLVGKLDFDLLDNVLTQSVKQDFPVDMTSLQLQKIHAGNDLEALKKIETLEQNYLDALNPVTKAKMMSEYRVQQMRETGQIMGMGKADDSLLYKDAVKMAVKSPVMTPA